jgi:hypothetical protein
VNNIGRVHGLKSRDARLCSNGIRCRHFLKRLCPDSVIPP